MARGPARGDQLRNSNAKPQQSAIASVTPVLIAGVEARVPEGVDHEEFLSLVREFLG